MGDGGVACVPAQHVIEKFANCGGKSNTTSKFTTSSSSSSASCLKLKRMNDKMKSKRGQELVVKSVVGKVGDSNGEVDKDEVEEGELGTLPVFNGEFTLEKPAVRKYELKSEIERVDNNVADKWRKGGELEKGVCGPGKWRRGEVAKNESADVLEKGEFVPDRWRRSEVVVPRDDHSYSRSRRFDSTKSKGQKIEHERTPFSSSKEKGWRGGHECSPPPLSRDKGRKADWSPPYGKYSSDREFIRRGGAQHTKRSSRFENSVQDRNSRFPSKIMDGEVSAKNELSSGNNGRILARESSCNNRLKRHGADSDGSDRKHRGEDEYPSSKSRRLSDDSNRAVYSSEHNSRRSVERPYKNAMSSSRNILADRHSSRHYESSRSGYERNNSSPHHFERSPRDRARNSDHRGRSPARRDRSPYDRSHRYDRSKSPYDRRNQSPGNLEQSPPDQARNNDRRDRTPNFLERSPRDRDRLYACREGNKSDLSEKRDNHIGGKQHEKTCQKSASGREMTKDSENGSILDKDTSDAVANPQTEELLPDLMSKAKESPLENGATEDLASMEEDMDICNTPPHVSTVNDTMTGKWYYLDHFGLEQGPSRLSDLKILLDEGTLVSDHLIKHLDSDRWVTIENAVSPLITATFPSVVPDNVTQLVSPPEAPGNILEDNEDTGEPTNLFSEKVLVPSSFPLSCSMDSKSVSEPSQDLCIDDRVGALLDGFTVIPGRELEAVGEALQMTFEPVELERWEDIKGDCCDEKSGIASVSIDNTDGSSALTPLDKDISFDFEDSGECVFGLWSCKGGDWKRNDEAFQDRYWRRKFVLNDGYPLCQMPKSGHEDPRWQHKDDLYFHSQIRRLDLPPWAFNSQDECSDSNTSRSSQPKPVIAKGIKGTMLPVVRINACVVKDHGSFDSESRTRGRAKERYSSRASRLHSVTGDAKRSSEENARMKHYNMHDHDPCYSKSTSSLAIPKDRICTADELQLHFGNWFYLDGAGHEQGPYSFSELQLLADHGTIQKHSSIFRKVDKTWVPVTSSGEASDPPNIIHHEKNSDTTSGFALSDSSVAVVHEGGRISSTFHLLHPQFIGYARGKLHELVMKSYKSREFAAAINEVLDPWINARLPKREMDKHVYSPAIFQKSDLFRSNKRARIDGLEEAGEMEDDVSTPLEDECTFDDLCTETTMKKEFDTISTVGNENWGQLTSHVLARVFHFLKADIQSLASAALTCNHWRLVVKFYRDISRQVDLFSVGPKCTDSMLLKIMGGYNKSKVDSLLLRGCTSISSKMLEEVLQSFPSLSSIDIRGCIQLEDLPSKYSNIKWVKSQDSYLKLKHLKNITERSSSAFKTYNGPDGRMDDSSGLKEYLESSKRDSANQLFQRSLYKRSKLFDARKSSAILPRDAHLRRLAMRKSENGYKRMEKFLASSLKEIMKENIFDFFVPKVAQIQKRMQSGYYSGRGLTAVKEDISRMCRDAIKAKNRDGNTRDMNRVTMLFIRLATSLEGGLKSYHLQDEMTKSLKDDSPPGFSSASLKYKKSSIKSAEKKYSFRSNGSSFINGVDYGECASDREIKRRLSKLNVKSLDSGSETSDDFDRSSGDTSTESESSASETESDLDLRPEIGDGESRGETYFTPDDEFDSSAYDREWGARMTKASLVPPVTRKYEVIDHYVIVADEEEVERKMSVSLPEDYSEKLSAQRNGTEESDMEIPEVKDFKPRKQLGDEVIEQEVYGIDPYTHNLLLDSMPQDSDWSLLDKHLFIEDVLLRTLNWQVRQFTGTTNTPMMYPLKPVFEEILEKADKDHDRRMARLCQFILEAINTRPGDNYVSYRKGLGVVCNKEGGFSEEDFVVEFLGEVYPAWKWFEKQDGIRSLQKNSNDPAPEFYNIHLERPKGDADGYDLVVVDAMHKANYASRICHSCRPNCEAKVTAVDGQYQIGIYTVRPIGYGEEVTFDYNSVTESKEEYEASVCLCGSQVCRGSYLNLTGEGAFQKVLEEYHGILDRHRLLLEACELNSVTEEDYIDLGKAGLGSCLLGGLPDWLVAYSARLVRFINFERTKLPDVIFKHNVEEKKKYYADVCLDVEKSDAEIQAEGVYNQRLQNLAITLDKVRYVMRCVFGDPKKAPPPLERLDPVAAVSCVWRGEGSLVDELIQSIAPHVEDGMLRDLKAKIRAHDPSGSDDIVMELKKSLLWLREEVRELGCSNKCRHDAAADLLHIYAYTKCFFRIREYKTVTSPPVYISPLDLCPKYADKLGSSVHEYCKTYGENYCLGQLIYWYNQASADPDDCLARASRGCLSLPDIGSFYAKVQKPSRQRIYGRRTVKFMLARMEKHPQRPWPKDRIWLFKNIPKIVGSPMLDAVLHQTPLDREMIQWLKNRPSIFQAMWDR